MRTEVHVHGSIFLCKGVRLSQVDQAIRPWLEYLDVDTMADAHSLEREEPGVPVAECHQLVVGSRLHDRAGVHHVDAVGHFHDVWHGVADEHDADAVRVRRGRRRAWRASVRGTVLSREHFQVFTAGDGHEASP